MTTRTTLTLATVLGSLILAPAWSAITRAADEKPTRDVLELRIQVQNLKDQLQSVRQIAAQCDANWAKTRTQLAGALLESGGAANDRERADLKKLVEDSGFVLAGPSGDLAIESRKDK